MGTKLAIAGASPPFQRQHQLDSGLDDWLPGNTLPTCPRYSLDSAALKAFLVGDVCPTKLNRLAPHLWMCSTPSHTNVPPLHSHAVHNRTIVLTEDPGLHLVWETGRIFIKPLPTYLLSYTFWLRFLLNDESCADNQVVTQAALGLLRSYHYCLRHESDLRIAQQPHLNLIPPGVTWKQWSEFSSSFDAIRDNDVAPRYHYGKLQHSRLHWLVRIHLRELNYYYIDGVYDDSFARYYGPLLFLFGILSVLLSAMQVGMAVEQLQSHDWVAFWAVCRWFSVASLLLCALTVFYLGLSFSIKSTDELLWSATAQHRARSRSKAQMNSA
ncbi:hypothetical protein XANCAGTX0491_003868 [Xanthoria calcicola]